MKKNLYYASVYKRQNLLKMTILNILLGLSSYPRLLLEVFLRRNMGERYFNLASAITAAVLAGAMPLVLGIGRRPSFVESIERNKLYYAFLAVFLVFSYLRHREIKREPSVFDFARFSASKGIIHPFFFNIKLLGKAPSVRTVEIYYEALPFFIGGFLLSLTGLNPLLGVLWMFCALMYSFSHAGAYMIGDHFIMDRIDEIICNEDLTQAFVKDKPSQRGFQWYGKKPTSEALREEYVEDICFENIDEDEAVAT